MKYLASAFCVILNLSCQTTVDSSSSEPLSGAVSETAAMASDPYGDGVLNGNFGPEFETTNCGLIEKKGGGVHLKDWDGADLGPLSLSADQQKLIPKGGESVCLTHTKSPDQSREALKDIHPKRLRIVDPRARLPYLLYPKRGKSDECSTLLEEWRKSARLDLEGFVGATMDRGARFKIRISARELNDLAKKDCVLMIYTPRSR